MEVYTYLRIYMLVVPSFICIPATCESSRTEVPNHVIAQTGSATKAFDTQQEPLKRCWKMT